MCGETFSSKYTPEEKRAAAKAHPLQRPGRWSVVYTVDWSSREDPRHFDEHDTAYFDYDSAKDSSYASRNGYATKAEAETALRLLVRKQAHAIMEALQQACERAPADEAERMAAECVLEWESRTRVAWDLLYELAAEASGISEDAIPPAFRAMLP